MKAIVVIGGQTIIFRYTINIDPLTKCKNVDNKVKEIKNRKAIWDDEQ